MFNRQHGEDEMTTDETLCICTHDRGQHTTEGDCAVDRADGGLECGCQRFQEAAR